MVNVDSHSIRVVYYEQQAIVPNIVPIHLIIHIRSICQLFVVAALLLPVRTMVEAHGAVVMTSKNIDMTLGKLRAHSGKTEVCHNNFAVIIVFTIVLSSELIAVVSVIALVVLVEL